MVETSMPHDADLVDLVADWLPERGQQEALFAANAARLYGGRRSRLFASRTSSERKQMTRACGGLWVPTSTPFNSDGPVSLSLFLSLSRPS